MKAILAYLNRGHCKNCSIDDTGKLNHCESCMLLFSAALDYANDLSKKPNYVQRKQIEAERVADVSMMKKTHNWVQVQTFPDGTRGRMMPFASHCRKCGLTMTAFKVTASKCPK